MSKFIRHKLRELRFSGGRFDANSGWLDFDVLPELTAYKRILIETAKEEWRRRHPGRWSLPRGFSDGIRLAFRQVRDESCVIPIERFVEVGDDTAASRGPDEVDAAAALIDKTVLAAQHDMRFPENLPPRVIPLFGGWGRTLRPDEGIELLCEGKTERPRFDARTRERILATAQGTYEDRIDLVGEVRAASLLKASEGGTFDLTLEDGSSVKGTFTGEQEATVTEALHKHRVVRLRIQGIAEFTRCGTMHRIVRVDRLQERSVHEERFDPNAPPIWEVVAAIGEEIPPEEWEKVPKDLARNLDHYLYGAPKESEE